VIDNLVIGTTHALLLLAAWRLVNRPELDDETAVTPKRDGGRPGWGGKRA